MPATTTFDQYQAKAEGLQIPGSVLSQYVIDFNRVTRLDMSGEFCEHCDDEGAYVQVQFYGIIRPECLTIESESEVAHGSSCAPCLPRALQDHNVDPTEKLILEYER